MIESKALAQVAVRIICLVSPLRLNVEASTHCQDSMKPHHHKWEHPPWRKGVCESVSKQSPDRGPLMEQVESLYGSFWKKHVTCCFSNGPFKIELISVYQSQNNIYTYQNIFAESQWGSQIWTSVKGPSPVSVFWRRSCWERRVFNIKNDDIASRR